MKPTSKLFPGLVFVFCLGLVGFVVGGFVGGMFFVPEGSGLAGGAIVAGYAAMGAFAALVTGVILSVRLPRPHLVKAMYIALVGAFIVAGVIYVRIQSMQRDPDEQPPGSPGPTTAPAKPITVGLPVSTQAETPVGVGFVRPHLLAGQRLYFYGHPDFTQLPDTMTPLDSLVFGEGRHHVDLVSAPPWLWPEVMKLDYDLLFLRAKTLTRNWVEVVVNHETGRTSWIDRHAVALMHWPTFLLHVVAVEVHDPEGNPVRVKPLDHAAVLADATVPLQPLAVQGSWLHVSTNGLADRIAPTGWIRWRDGDRLLITYSLLR